MLQALNYFTDSLFALDIGCLEEFSITFGHGTQIHRENGYPALAEWYDGIGAAIAAMLDSRRGDAIDVGISPNLVERTAALSDADLRLAGAHLYRSLAGVPKSSVGDFVHATIGLLNAEGLSRQRR